MTYDNAEVLGDAEVSGSANISTLIGEFKKEVEARTRLEVELEALWGQLHVLREERGRLKEEVEKKTDGEDILVLLYAMEDGRRIDAIRSVRAITNMSLKDAKDFVEGPLNYATRPRRDGITIETA